MTYQTVFKRFELKYILTTTQYNQLSSLITEHMNKDSFGQSRINNIYFDTPTKLLIRRSLEKPEYKEKLRVRSYGTANEDSTVFIEVKKKFDGIVYKRRISATEKEAMAYLVEDEKLSQSGQIVNEIDYLKKFYETIEPSMCIAYDRTAYFSKTDPNFRLTFDKNINYRTEELTLKKNIPGKNILKKDQVLMEVKTGLGIPLWLTEFLCKNKIYKTSFSKYGNAYKDFILNNNSTGGEYVA